MITDIEKQFFETFGIKPRSYLLCTSCWDCIDAQPCEQCHYGKLIEDEYPKITDRILLELICILSESPISISFDTLVLGASDVEKLKGYILLACMGFAKDIKHQVRTLFEEEQQ